MQILTADYAAEYGRSSGAQIRILTRSGGQRFPRRAYEYVRNNVHSTPTPGRAITTPRPDFRARPFRYNQYGYNIGGPFYIPGKFNSDKNKYLLVLGPGMGEVPLHRYSVTGPFRACLMRQGDFSELLDPSNIYYGKAIQLNESDHRQQPYPGQHHPGDPAQPERPRHSEGVSGCRTWPRLINGNQQLLHHGAAPAGSAQGHPRGRHQRDREAAPAVPPQQLRVLRISAARRHADETPKYLQPPEPDQLARLRLDHHAARW